MMMANYAEAVARLRSAGKTANNAPAYSRYVNRPIGRYLAGAAFLLGMTPNQVTAVSALFTFTGVGLIATVTPTATTAVLIAFVLMMGYALDSADGQLARLRGGGTALGEWLDHVIDSAKIPAIHLSVLVNFYRFSEPTNSVVLALPILFTLVAVVYFFTFILTDHLRRINGDKRQPPSGSGYRSSIRSLILLPSDFGLLCVCFLFLAAESVFVYLYAFLLIAASTFLIAALVRWRSEMASTVKPIPTSLERIAS